MGTHDESAHVREYADGEVVFEQGSEGDWLYIVLEGGVCIRKRGDLFSAVLAELGPGEIFGEVALFDRRPHSAAATACGPTRLALYDRASFVESMRRDPTLALDVIESLTGRLRETTDRLQAVAERHILDRTEAVLVQKAVLESELSS